MLTCGAALAACLASSPPLAGGGGAAGAVAVGILPFLRPESCPFGGGGGGTGGGGAVGAVAVGILPFLRPESCPLCGGGGGTGAEVAAAFAFDTIFGRPPEISGGGSGGGTGVLAAAPMPSCRDTLQQSASPDENCPHYNPWVNDDVSLLMMYLY